MVGPLLQLLFIKPVSGSARGASGNSYGRPQVRSLPGPGARRYQEACIYEMDLKKGKKYSLFLSPQAGVEPEGGRKQSAKGLMSRYVMTSPPLLATRKTAKQITAVTCPRCGELDIIKYVLSEDFFGEHLDRSRVLLV